MKLPKHLKGKYVTRAAFAKLQGEKQRLEKDIKLMVKGESEGVKAWAKWRKHYKFWDDINYLLKEIAKKELPKLRKQFGLKDDSPYDKDGMMRPKLDSNPKAFK